MTSTTATAADKALTMMLKVSPLTAPESDSNWLDWSYLVHNGLSLAKLDHHISEEIEIKDRSPTWRKENQRILVLLGSIVDQSNTRYIREGGDNTFVAWKNLQAAHEDETAGGRMYWLRNLILTRMEEDDIDKHIETLLSAFDKLKSLISTDSPLTPDDILTTALFISLPSEWTPVVAPLMQRPSVKSTDVIRALRAESTRKKSSLLHEQSEIQAARASSSVVDKKHCTHCDRDGHTLQECYTAAGILKKHKQDFKNSQTKSQGSSNKTKAGKTSVVTLGDKSDNGDSDSGDSVPQGKSSASSARLNSTTASAVRGKPRDWLVDSGCGMAMSPQNKHVTDRSLDVSRIHLADDSIISSSHSGSAVLPFPTPTSIPALQVPQLHKPLLSVAGVCDSGLDVLFTKDGCGSYKRGDVQTTDNEVAMGERRGDLYVLPSKVNRSQPLNCLKAHADDSLYSWHVRLGHVGIKALRRFLTVSNIHPSISNSIEVEKCEVCISAKLHRRSFKSRANHRAEGAGQLVHSDVGCFEEVSWEGYKYWATFIDDVSKFTRVYLMKSKDSTMSCFKIFRSFFEKRHGPILSLRSDNGGEYMSHEFKEYLNVHGITHEPGPPHSPELNGVAERANRVLGERVRCLLISSGLSKRFWADAVRHFSHTLNTIPCHGPSGFKSPDEILTYPPINPRSLHPFGCLSWYKIPEAC